MPWGFSAFTEHEKWSQTFDTKQIKNSTAANIVNAIGRLGCHWTWKVAFEVQNFRYNTRPRKVIRHSWSPFNNKKTKTPLQPTSSMPLGFSAFTEHEKWPWKFRTSNMTPARTKWLGTAGHHSTKKTKTPLQPTSSMPSGSSASTEHEKCH